MLSACSRKALGGQVVRTGLIAAQRVGTQKVALSVYAQNQQLGGFQGSPAVLQRRQMSSSYVFNSASELADSWPIPVRNTILNVCPQGSRMVVERLGKLHIIQEPGWFIAIPFIDQIAYSVDMREMAVEIDPQASITKDNVSVDVSGNLYVQFHDPERAAYGNSNPLYAVRQHAQSAMRAAIGELELDEILHARAKLNKMIRESVHDAADAWGLEVKRYEITEVTPDAQIRHAMDKQAAAERARRELVLTAEGEKKAFTLHSEGVKIKLINESEGHLIKVRNEAEASRERLEKEAQGEAAAMLLNAEAKAKSIELISAALMKDAGVQAAQLTVAQNYIDMYGEMGKQSNTMLFCDRPGDVNNLMAQAATVLQSVLGKGTHGGGGGSGGGGLKAAGEKGEVHSSSQSSPPQLQAGGSDSSRKAAAHRASKGKEDEGGDQYEGHAMGRASADLERRLYRTNNSMLQ